MRHRRRTKNRTLTTSRIVYTDRRRPDMPPDALVVDTPRGEVLDDDHAAAMVAVRTGIPLTQVSIVEVDDLIPTDSPHTS